MDKESHPEIYSIAAHRGFADALVAGLVPRYSEPDFRLARLTLIVPSSRASRSITEAFIRHAGETGSPGLLMPRMVMIGDENLDEAIGGMLDPIGATEIPSAVDPTRRWLELAGLIRAAIEAEGQVVPGSAALLRLAREFASTMDRLLAEGKTPEDLLDKNVLGEHANLARHWQDSTRFFAIVQAHWRARLAERGEIDLATRRNLLFDRTARLWRDNPPDTPIVAAGVTSAAPSLARLLRAVADLPKGAVILPDLDLSMSDSAWDELGLAGQPPEAGQSPFSGNEAATHPQYHLKLLLNRMGISRKEVRPWHRRGIAAAEPERSHAISSLFLPPEASRNWVNLEPQKRRLSGVRLMTSATVEEEAQSIGVMVREALDEPEKRVSIITPDRALARRVAQHLARWNIEADDSAGHSLSLTPSGRFLLQLAELVSEGFAPVQTVAALAHPFVRRDDGRREWLESLRRFERRLRGPPPTPGLASLAQIARAAGVEPWWDEVADLVAPLEGLATSQVDLPLSDALGILVDTAAAMAGPYIWAQEDGRSLSLFVDELRLHAHTTDTNVLPGELHAILTDAMQQIAVRPPYGGHPRVAIYGLLESRMTRADLVICGGLNEGTWPAAPSPEPLLAPAILRALGMPGPEFRIGLSAHDLASALGAPEVVLTRSLRDADGPTIPSRFLQRIEALLGERVSEHQELRAGKLARLLDRAAPRDAAYPRPEPRPPAELRNVDIKVTALDRLLGDPYQFYAQEILALGKLDPLDADPSAKWQGILAHRVLEHWHDAQKHDPSADILQIADAVLREENIHPLMWGLWRPRLFKALQNIAAMIEALPDRKIVAVEASGEMQVDGVRVYGRADRIDQYGDGSLAIVDYKTGGPPSANAVAKGYALQLGILGLIAGEGGFEDLRGEARAFEYWSLAKDKGELGYISDPVKRTNRQSGLEPDEFLPKHEEYLRKAIGLYIKGAAPFTAKANPDYPGYTDFDQLMRLEEWQIGMLGDNEGADQ